MISDDDCKEGGMVRWDSYVREEMIVQYVSFFLTYAPRSRIKLVLDRQAAVNCD